MSVERHLSVGSSHALQESIYTLINRFSPFLAKEYNKHNISVEDNSILDFWTEVLFVIEERFPSENTLQHRIYLRDCLGDSCGFLRYFEERIIPLIIKYRIPDETFKYPTKRK